MISVQYLMILTPGSAGWVTLGSIWFMGSLSFVLESFQNGRQDTCMEVTGSLERNCFFLNYFKYTKNLVVCTQSYH